MCSYTGLLSPSSRLHEVINKAPTEEAAAGLVPIVRETQAWRLTAPPLWDRRGDRTLRLLYPPQPDFKVWWERYCRIAIWARRAR